MELDAILGFKNVKVCRQWFWCSGGIRDEDGKGHDSGKSGLHNGSRFWDEEIIKGVG